MAARLRCADRIAAAARRTCSQPVQSLDRRVQQLGIGRKRDRLGLHRGVDRDPLEIPGPQRAAGMRDPQAFGQQQLQLVTQPLAPVAQIRAFVRELVLENSSPVNCWKYGSCTQRSQTPSSDSP